MKLSLPIAVDACLALHLDEIKLFIRPASILSRRD